MEEKTAENLCLGFGCWRKGFFAKVSIRLFLSEKRIYLFFSGLDKRPSEKGDKWIGRYILQVEFCLLRLGLFDSEANTVNAKAFDFVGNIFTDY